MRTAGWLVGCGLTVAAGCATPSATTDPLDATVTGRTAQPELIGDALAPTTGPAAEANELIVPPAAWRRAGERNDPRDWQRALEAEVARAYEAPSDELQRAQTLAERGPEAVGSSIDSTIAGSVDRLDAVADGLTDLDAELAGIKAEGGRTAEAWLERGQQRLSTVRVGEDRVVLGFKGSTNPALGAPGPSMSANLGGLGRLPAKVQVGIALGDKMPGLAPVSDAAAAAHGFAREQQRTFGLVGEPSAVGTNPDDSAAHKGAGGPRLAIADRLDDVRWWLVAGLAPDPAGNAVLSPDVAGQRPVDIDAGVQYELGPQAAVAAVYGYRGPTDRMIDSLASAPGGQRADEQLHNASLRLIWRFTTATGAQPAPAK